MTSPHTVKGYTKGFKCKYCGKTFHSKGGFHTHIKYQHPSKKGIHIESSKLSGELGYIVGVLLSDGWLSRNRDVKLSATDKDFVERFKEALEEWSQREVSLRVKRSKEYTKGRTYICVLCSSEANSFLKKKINNLDWIKKAGEKVKREILKGLFDGDGFVTETRIGFGNKSERIIGLFERLCSSFSIETNKRRTKDGTYHIEVSCIPSKIRFFDKIGITIKRKRRKIEDFINNHKKRRRAYFLTFQLRENGKTYKEISRYFKDKLNFEVSPTNICNWYNGKYQPRAVQ